MKRILRRLDFIPFINRFLHRKYYATGFGTYLINTFFKKILRIGHDFEGLLHFTSRAVSGKNIIIEQGEGSEKNYLSFATSGGCYYQALNGIEIGTGTLWSYGCQFISANHDFRNYSDHISQKPIIIGRDVWMGSHVIILPGVRIGNNTIIGAGSVVTRDIPENSVAVGNPANVIRENV